MASKKALNARNLEALGAERLAELLIEISTGKSGAKRLLRLELAGAEGTAELAREVRRRLATIGRSRGSLDLQNIGSWRTSCKSSERSSFDASARRMPPRPST